MRQFKFRAYDKRYGEWLLGYNLPNLGGFDMFGEVIVMGEWGSAAWSHIQDRIDIDLMQFTGLKDKNDKDIYEGDIVKLKFYDFQDGESYEVGVVRWFEQNAAFKWISDDPSDGNNYWLSQSDNTHREVIGNIHDNPELLN